MRALDLGKRAAKTSYQAAPESLGSMTPEESSGEEVLYEIHDSVGPRCCINFSSAAGETVHAQQIPIFFIIMTIDAAHLDEGRGLTVTGTVTCSEPGDLRVLGMMVHQSAGHFGKKSVNGEVSSDFSLPCDTTPQSYSLTLVAFNGFFKSGLASFTGFAFACSQVSGSCDRDDPQRGLRID